MVQLRSFLTDESSDCTATDLKFETKQILDDLDNGFEKVKRKKREKEKRKENKIKKKKK